MVQINGQRVEPAEMETALRRHPAVQHKAVIARSERDAVNLHAFVVMESGVSIETDELRSALRRSLPGFMVPSRITALGSLPTLPSGKIDEQALLALR